MRFKFWLKRTSLVLLGSFVLLSTVYFLRGRDAKAAMREGALWAVITAFIYGSSAAYHISRHRQCGLDDDAECIVRRRS